MKKAKKMLLSVLTASMCLAVPFCAVACGSDDKTTAGDSGLTKSEWEAAFTLGSNTVTADVNMDYTTWDNFDTETKFSYDGTTVKKSLTSPYAIDNYAKVESNKLKVLNVVNSLAGPVLEYAPSADDDDANATYLYNKDTYFDSCVRLLGFDYAKDAYDNFKYNSSKKEYKVNKEFVAYEDTSYKMTVTSGTVKFDSNKKATSVTFVATAQSGANTDTINYTASYTYATGTITWADSWDGEYKEVDLDVDDGEDYKEHATNKLTLTGPAFTYTGDVTVSGDNYGGDPTWFSFSITGGYDQPYGGYLVQGKFLAADLIVVALYQNEFADEPDAAMFFTKQYKAEYKDFIDGYLSDINGEDGPVGEEDDPADYHAAQFGETLSPGKYKFTVAAEDVGYYKVVSPENSWNYATVKTYNEMLYEKWSEVPAEDMAANNPFYFNEANTYYVYVAGQDNFKVEKDDSYVPPAPAVPADWNGTYTGTVESAEVVVVAADGGFTLSINGNNVTPTITEYDTMTSSLFFTTPAPEDGTAYYMVNYEEAEGTRTLIIYQGVPGENDLVTLEDYVSYCILTEASENND